MPNTERALSISAHCCGSGQGFYSLLGKFTHIKKNVQCNNLSLIGRIGSSAILVALYSHNSHYKEKQIERWIEVEVQSLI